MIEWKKIPNYSLYEASTEGHIKTFNWKNKGKEAIMKPAPDKNGYLRTMLKNDSGKFETIKVHRIIAQTFIPNPENKPQINHKNCIKNDNSVENIEWCTHSENQLHSYKYGRKSNKGEKNPATKLKDSDVLKIRSEYTYGRKGGRIKGAITKPMLAKKYNVNVSVIKCIVTRKTWKHI